MKYWARWITMGYLLGCATVAQAQTCSTSIPASTPTADFVDHGDGTVTHSKTGLMWKQCAQGQSGATCATGTASAMTWRQALSSAVADRTAGYSDWRLPNLKELRSIVEEKCYSPAINTTVFPNTSASFFWSASTYALNSNYAWFVDFVTGNADGSLKDGANRVRLVRAGQSFGSFDRLNPTAVSSLSLQAIGQTSLTLNATSNLTGTGYWLAVPMGAIAPTAAQVRSGVNYGGVAIAASGYVAMMANVPTSFNIRNLNAGTAYDFYLVVADATGALGTAPAKVQGTTIAPAAAPVVASFAFDPIADQAAGTLVPVRIRAVDVLGATVAGFNEVVPVLGLGSARVVPSTLKFTAGMAAASLDYRGRGVAGISAQYSTATGSVVGGASNQFMLTSAVAQTFTVQGVTEPGASLSLISIKDGSTTPTVVSDATGAFQILNVPIGYWIVNAAKPGYAQVCPPKPAGVVNDCMVRVNDNLTINPQLRKPGRAVIVIPGMMGSTLSAAGSSWFDAQVPRRVGDHIIGQAPVLPKDKCSVGLPCDMRGLLQIYDPSMPKTVKVLGIDVPTPSAQCLDTVCTYMGSALLEDSLKRAGFEVFPAPWDWRLPFDEAAEIFLKPRIEEAMNATGATKVDIVAHSMGGLVARSYIQNPNNRYLRDNVDRFVMLGTPNTGATNAYILMEGGDPLTLDRAVAKLSPLAVGAALASQAAFYTGAANELWRTMYGEDMVTLNGDKEIDIFSSDYKKGVSRKSIREFFVANVPGGFDLLPTYDMLKKMTPTWLHADATDFANGVLQPNTTMNARLRALNTNYDRAMQYGKIDVTLLLSESERTLNALGYENAGTDTTYPYGEPIYFRNESVGDGTVLRNQSVGPFTAGITTSAKSTHPALLGNARCDVVRALQTGRTGLFNVAECVPAPVATAGAPNATVQVVTPPISVASVDVEGQYSALLIASDGKRAGTAAGVSGIFSEIVGSDVRVTPYQLHVAQGSPVTGTYQLQLTADSLLTNTAARVTLNYLLPTVGTQSESVRILVKATPYLASIVQDSAAARWMILIDPVQPPLALKAAPAADLTQLSWTAPADATVTGYNVYYRTTLDDRFIFLGHSTAASFATTIPWAGTYAGSSEFIVLSTNAAGVESPIRGGNSVRNVSYAKAAFTATGVNANGVMDQNATALSVSFVDQSEATAAIQSWAWDFNGDGVIDSTVQNPTFNFPQVGSYTVSLKVTAADGSTNTRTFQSFVNLRSVPDAPTGSVAAPGSTQASISFTAPVNDGNSLIQIYTASCAAAGQITQTATGTASPLVVTGLTNGVAYTCSVTATNGVGTGAAAVLASVTPLPAQTIGPITFTPSTLTLGASTIASATASSGLPVVFDNAATPTICTVAGSTVSGIAGGTCTITATQSGGTTFLPAPPVTASVLVTAPAVLFTPNSLTFTDQHLNTSSSAQTVALTNTGNAALNIASAVASSATWLPSEFAVTHNCGPTLGAGVACNLMVTFTPAQLGTRLGALRLTSNAATSPNSILLSGNGVASNVPICTLTALPSLVRRGGSSVLTASCSPAATSYTWTGGTCAGKTSSTCNVAPGVTTTYGVTGTNAFGAGSASVTVTLKATDISPILMLLD